MKKVAGFTLIEIMVVVVILAVLSSLAYPSYSNYLKKGYRSEGRSALLDIQAKQERYYMQNYKYTGLDKLNVTETTENNKYKISIDLSKDEKTFTLTAENLFDDTECGSFILNSLSEKSYTGVGDQATCW
ncbi:type IV pilin protein [Pseudomonas sp. F1_0610]|uniref:type IV pilin protein n=1 Tax=Pseudomonas sp. F1_0610 TaxID=3114284 RepID=UPI0039C2C448